MQGARNNIFKINFQASQPGLSLTDCVLRPTMNTSSLLRYDRPSICIFRLLCPNQTSDYGSSVPSAASAAQLLSDCRPLRGLQTPVGMVTALPLFSHLDLDELPSFVVGGHDIRRTGFMHTVRELHSRSNIFPEHHLTACAPDLEVWSANVRPGTILQTGSTISALADLPEVERVRTPREAIDRIQTDLKAFREKNELQQVVVVNVASTEPPFETGPDHSSMERLNKLLDRNGSTTLPASSIYAYAAIDLGLPYVNFTPSLGSSLPALDELARVRKVP